MGATLKQRANDDCTICCIAMATGYSYDDVMAVAAKASGGYRYNGTPGTMSPKGVLIDLGIAAERFPMATMGEALRRRVLFGRRAILSVPSLNGFDGHHDVYWDGWRLHDPSNQTTYPASLPATAPDWATVLDEVRFSIGARHQKLSVHRLDEPNPDPAMIATAPQEGR